MGEISKLQAAEYLLDSRRWRASEARGIVPCDVCVYRRCINVDVQFANMHVSVCMYLYHTHGSHGSLKTGKILKFKKKIQALESP